MVDYELSEHARDMLRERDIPEDWVRLAVEDPKEPKDDGTVHYTGYRAVWGTVFACGNESGCQSKAHHNGLL